jgi:drug/metabolite transporter (DMT)-like permease
MVIALLARQKFPMHWRQWAWLIPLGALNFAVPFYLMIRAQVTLPSSTAAMFIASIPLFTLLMTRVILKRAVSWRRWAGFAIGFVGLLWLTRSSTAIQAGSDADWFPQALLISACVCFALSAIVIRKMPPMAPLPATAMMLWFGGLMLVPFGGLALVDHIQAVVAVHAGWHDPSMVALLALIFLGVLPTGIGQAMRTLTIQRHGPVFFSIVSYLVPIWATMLGIVVLNEQLTLSVTLAFLVILTGLALSHDGGFSTGRGRR